MNTNTQVARAEIKNLIMKIGKKNILNYHLTEISERTGVTCCDLQNAMSYYQFSKAQAKFRELYF